jgi:hypothetical protein
MQINSLKELSSTIDSLLNKQSINISESLAQILKTKVSELLKLGRSKQGLDKVREIYNIIDSAEPISIKDFLALSNTKIKMVALEEQVSIAKARQFTQDDIAQLYNRFFAIARYVIDDNNIPREDILLQIRNKLKSEL